MSGGEMTTWLGGRSTTAVPLGPEEASVRDAPLEHAGLEVENLTVRFGGLLALNEVSLSVRPHEIVGLIGPNGAGKTTLFNAVSGFVRPTLGTIRWQGHALRKHRPHDLGRLGIARTLQGVGLCRGLSALENVVCGAQPRLRADLASSLGGLWRSSREERHVTERAAALLGDLGVAEWAQRLPDALPYGVQKRVALARALIGEPQLLLLDEPMSGLSSTEMDDLSDRIRAQRERISVLVVEHRMDFVMATCDRIVVFNFGEVVMSGTPDEVRASPEVTEAYLGDAVHSDGTPPSLEPDVARTVRTELRPDLHTPDGEPDDARG